MSCPQAMCGGCTRKLNGGKTHPNKIKKTLAGMAETTILLVTASVGVGAGVKVTFLDIEQTQGAVNESDTFPADRWRQMFPFEKWVRCLAD